METEQEKLPLNLLTNYEETVQAIAEIEGNGWRKMSEESPGEYSLGGILHHLKTSEWEGAYTLYGNGGWNRYYVSPDGTVRFSKAHGKKDAEHARELGFEIV